VIGLQKFREAFAKHEDKFILIGGMAAAIQADDAGLVFRATKDFDVVLVVEILDSVFLGDFWDFVKSGGYSYEKSGGGKQFYRFSKPSADGFPHQIELFARKPSLIELPPDANITPIPVGEDASSLSAILLDEHYYQCLIKGRTVAQGIPVLGPEMMIPFKAKAYLDLQQRKNAGERIDQKDINKHRSDVVRLLGLLPGDAKIELPTVVLTDLGAFLDVAANDDTFDPRQNIGVAKADAIARLKAIYGLG
jgi:hypothetical protein